MIDAQLPLPSTYFRLCAGSTSTPPIAAPTMFELISGAYVGASCAAHSVAMAPPE